MARIHNVAGYRHFPLHEGWELISTQPGQYTDSAQLEDDQDGQSWLSAQVPGTVITTLSQHQQWDLAAPRNVDELDWWYRSSFALPQTTPGKRLILNFAGLATVSDIWLNGQHILATENMFRTYSVDITEHVCPNNTLVICFRALNTLLAQKKPRPRWRTQLVEHQQLRWCRTTLLGHMSGWSPPMRPVGPWREIVIEEQTVLAVDQISIQSDVQGTDGIISVNLQARGLDDQPCIGAYLVLEDEMYPLTVSRSENNTSVVVHGQVSMPEVRLWWPHTHGPQPRYLAKVAMQYQGTTIEIDCGYIAFRRIEFLADPEQNFGLRVNGLPIFCRGSCWTPLDMETLTGTTQQYRAALTLAQRGGLNMLRVGGTMVYEHDSFYDLCDEMGILIWQDFMFANMDYPFTNEAFRQNSLLECTGVLQRLQAHPSLALLCGNSEIAQQTAMLGLPENLWSNEYFEQELRELCGNYVNVPYWSSSPNGGNLPFQANRGNSHYQGVGPFLRPLEDARRSEVHFASECLGFSHIPEDFTLNLFLQPHQIFTHHPRWKERVPRDTGAAWDFEDIRDQYLSIVFGLDPFKLRYSDMPRYLALSRVVTGEVLASVFAEWRRQRSVNNGGLTWFYRDLWPGAGWGMIDATGYPKAAYYYLRRVSLAQTCFFADEGLNGLWLHAINDSNQQLESTLQFRLYRLNGVLLHQTTQDITIPEHGEVEIAVEASLAHFIDSTYAYRFGPPGYDFVIATLSNSQTIYAEAFYFPLGQPTEKEMEPGLTVEVTLESDGSHALTVRTEKFAQAVSIHTEMAIPEDNYFHLPPQGSKKIKLYARGNSQAKLRGYITALNTQREINFSYK